MRLLIQHAHSEYEISGVLTYINLIIPHLQSQGIEIKTISTKTSNIKKWISYIIWADIVHMNSNHLPFAILCKLFRKKIIIKYHYVFYQSTHFEYQFMTFSERLKTEIIYSLPKAHYPLKWKLHTGVKWASLASRLTTAYLADSHAACSNFLAESYAFPWHILTLYNPINNTINPKKFTDITKPYTFVFVGRLDRDKGVDILLEAIKLLKEFHQDFQVLIIGDGPLATSLSLLASELDIIDRVHFLGKLSHSEVLQKVRTSLALIAPSRWQEPAGYVVLEASSVQTCSIVSKVGGLPEMAGSSSLFFNKEDVAELANMMKYCLDNPEEVVERGFQASKYAADRFSSSKAATELIEICQQLTNIDSQIVAAEDNKNSARSPQKASPVHQPF